ncbi:MAG: transporter [Herminiimonas sp.]|nr:transporter [Herminiimonas sp.]
MTKIPLSAWLPIALAGFCSTMIGLGIGRFSYVPLMPLLIDSHWATPAAAAQFAAANLIGYLVGAVLAHPLSKRFGVSRSVRGAMLVVLFGLAGCGLYNGWAWVWVWRFLAGAAGGAVMILSVPHVMARVPPGLRGRTAGIVFSGIGVGIVLSGFAVPALGARHLDAAWYGLAGFVALGMLVAWPGFSDRSGSLPYKAAAPLHAGDGHSASPNTSTVDATSAARNAIPIEKTGPVPRGAFLALLLAYALDAIGYLPHTVFWVEYLVHGLGQRIELAGAFWALFGIGAALGPLFTGYAADRFGFRRSLVAVFSLKAIAIALPLMSTSLPALFASSFFVGALTPGLVVVVSGRLIEIVGTAGHLRSWALLTFVYAVLQAVGGYAMAALYGALHSFTVLFVIGAGALALSAIISVVGARLATPTGAATARP